MFFTVSLVKELWVHPREMGKHVRRRTVELLREAVEGKLVGNHGFVISMLQVEDVGRGVLENSMGCAVYKIKYRALVFCSFEKEILDCVVVSCNPHGIQCTLAGMVDAFVHRTQLPEDVNQFVNGAWVSNDGQVRIRANCGLRLRVISQRFESSKISVVGTINDSFCGVLFNEPDEAPTPMGPEDDEPEVDAAPSRHRLAEEGGGGDRTRQRLSSEPSTEQVVDLSTEAESVPRTRLAEEEDEDEGERDNKRPRLSSEPPAVNATEEEEE